PGSEKDRTWRSAIARREAIAELEQQFKLLEGLIDRQAVTARAIVAAMSLSNE
ncbi:MAG: hypothetical protein F6K28_48635, partial [Microcoleus sp. SIO2G3]|nr:hypothetical protein [Microcoleus sp. SIO2G3]